MRLPGRVDPVNDTMSTSGCARAPRRPPARAGDEVEHAPRQPGLVEDLGEDERGERRDLARLEHHRAAGRERGRDLRRTWCSG